MSGTYSVVMGDRGRLVIPAELRERWQLRPGAPLVMMETPDGIVVATREQMKRLVRHRLHGRSLVDDLLRERRELAATEDG